MRLVVGGEPVVADAVQVTQAGTKAAGEVFRLHAVHHVHAGLPVLGGGYKDQVLAQRVFRITHQHTFVTGGRKGSSELIHAHKDGITLHAGNLHPVAFQVPAGKRGAAHQVMRPEGIRLLEGDFIKAVLRNGGLYLAIGGGHTELAAHAANLLDKQFQHHHDLAHRQLVDGKVRKGVLHPQPPALTQKAVHEFRAAKKLTHDKGQQFGVALAVDVAVLLRTDADALLEGDFLFRAVGLLLADELRLASSGREKVVVGGKRVIPAPYDVRKVRAGRSGIIPHLLDTPLQAFHHAGGKRVTDFKVHL